jgi:hypothetical protein
VTRGRQYSTCPGHLGQCDTNRDDLICDTSSKAARASTVLSVTVTTRLTKNKMLATVSNHCVEKKNELAVAVGQIKSKTSFCNFSGFLKAAIFYFQTDLMLIDCNTTDILRGILVFDRV